jgi:hypothetical protein
LQRLSPFILAVLLSLLVVIAGLVHALKQHPPYAPQINAEQQTHGALKGEENAQARSPSATNADEEHGGKHAEKGEEDGTEFWPAFLGFRLKITDSLLAAFTLGLLVFTGLLWRSTDKLWAAGEKQLISSERSVAAQLEETRLSRRILEVQVRADITRSVSEIRNMEPGMVPQAHVVIENTGQTPAYDVEAIIGIGIGPFPMDGPVPDLPDIPNNSLSILGPKKDMHLTVFLTEPISESVLQELADGTKAINVIGRVDYRDVFAPDRWVTFNLFYGGAFGTPGTGVLFNGPDGNESH